MSTRAQALRLDSFDSYNTVAGYLMLPLMIGYVGLAIVKRHTLETAPDSKDSDSVPLLRYQAPDGLALTLAGHDFSPLLLQLHRLSGIFLVLLTLAQKHVTVPGLRRGMPQYRTYHWIAGYLTVFLMLSMSISGFLMRDTPVYSSFPTAMWLFFTPWPIIALAVLSSAYSKAWNAHGIAGNVALKACLSVPMARVMGGVFQRHAGGNSWLLEQWGYYTGIGMTACVIGVWAGWDVWVWYAAMKREERKGKGKAL